MEINLSSSLHFRHSREGGHSGFQGIEVIGSSSCGRTTLKEVSFDFSFIEPIGSVEFPYKRIVKESFRVSPENFNSYWL